MPGLRQVFVPQPIMGKTPAELRAYVDGRDPDHRPAGHAGGRRGADAPVRRATSSGPAEFDRSTPRLVEPDTEDNLHQLFLDNRWTDMLPIVLPTEARVAAMLAHTRRRPDEIVGRMRSTHFREHWEYSVEKVAVNAVMAGARPEYFPVILALAATGVTARSSSSSAMAAMAVVNGPIRHEIGMNAGIGAMGPYNHANATIGRAYGLLSQNGQGGSVPGPQLHGQPGQQLRLQQRHVRRERGAQPVGAVPRPARLPARRERGQRLLRRALDRRSRWGCARRYWREHVRNLLRGIDPNGPPTLLLDPIAARQFVDRGGFAKKDALIDWLHDNARMPAGEYWDYQLVQNYIYPRATFGEEPWATKLKAAPDEVIPMFRREDIHVVVVGGETNGYWRIMGCNYQKTVSVDDWR